MKKTLLVAAAALAIAACHKSPTAPAATRLALHPTESGDAAGGALSITLVSVENDSRCAVDVTCVSAGNATVRFTVSSAGGPPAAAALQALNTTIEPRSLTLDGYRITLDSLLPRPVSTQVITQDQYIAYLTVTGAK
jgi:uncharacterized lipoprotein YajG